MTLLISLLRELLSSAHVTQKDLALGLGMKPSHINLYFKGKSDIHSRKLVSILKMLGIDLESLVRERIEMLSRNEGKVSSENLFSKLDQVKDFNREPLLRIIKHLAG